MSFRISGLPAAEFQSLFALSDQELAQRGAQRRIADVKPGFPCRVSLEDAEPGEKLILLNYMYQPTASPYRASGPIFVRETAAETFAQTNTVPEQLRVRLLSVRAYDVTDAIADATVVEGRELETSIARVFEKPDVAYIHVHFARYGCYACRIDRA